MHPSPSLAELQRWMRWALTHPLGVARATAGERLPGLPERFERPSTDALATIAGDARSGRTSEERLSVYGSGYFSRLHGTLQHEYPRLEAALGTAPFRELVATHLLEHPSSSPSLADLGEGLADTLGAHPAGSEAPWLVDLASLERATAEVWLSDAGTAAGWTLSGTEDWEQVRLALTPATRLLRLGWDVAAWAPEHGPPARKPGWLVLWRVEASTGAEWMEDGPGRVLEALDRGAPLGEACELAGSIGLGAEDVTAAFAHWGARGWLTRARDGHSPRDGEPVTWRSAA